MKKQFWVDLRVFREDYATLALESGADALLVSEDHAEAARRIGKISVFTKKEQGVLYDLVRITQKSDEEQVVRYQGNIPVILENTDWTIIPLENLISRTSNLLQTVSGPEEAKLALLTMEKGADGIFLQPKSLSDIQRCGEIVRLQAEEDFSLVSVEITSITAVDMGYRCCIDTTSILAPGQGMLVGDMSSAFFLVHNENVVNPFCSARPFRVNAGAVHAYIRLPNNKTKYLSELQAGDSILAVNAQGKGSRVAVGRNKIERRPMLLIQAKSTQGQRVSLVLQNAETIRLTSEDGSPASVTTLALGDRVLAFFQEKTGRHFGEAISETISEQ